MMMLEITAKRRITALDTPRQHFGGRCLCNCIWWNNATDRIT